MKKTEKIVLAWYGTPKYSVRINRDALDCKIFEVIESKSRSTKDNSAPPEEEIRVIDAYMDLDDAEDAASAEDSKARTLSVLSLFSKTK